MTLLAETGNSIHRQLANAGASDIFVELSKIGLFWCPSLYTFSPVTQPSSPAAGDGDRHRVGNLAIDGQHHVNFSPPDEGTAQNHVDLVESHELALRPGVEDLYDCAAYFNFDVGKVAAPANSSAEKDQRHHIVRTSKADRC